MTTNNYFKVYVPQPLLGVFPFDDTSEASIALAWSGVQSMKAHVESVMWVHAIETFAISFPVGLVLGFVLYQLFSR